MILKKIKKILKGSAWVCITLQGGYDAYADQTSGIDYWRVGAKVGISSSSLWSICKNFDDTELYSAGIKGESTKKSFLETPRFTGSICVELAVTQYTGYEVGLGYLCQGGTLVVDKQNNLNDSYVKFITHNVFLSPGIVIYPLSLRPNTDIWKICLAGVFSFTPKKTCLVKKSGNAKEEKFAFKDNLYRDIALSLGTAYEWTSGLYLDLRSTLGFLGMLKEEINWFSQTDLSRTGTVKDKESIKNYFLSFTIGYQIFGNKNENIYDNDIENEAID
ncbi:hypothetical protein [Candidatus Cardinium hertigii]|jgi:hypothetical protein|uniref:Outer membrane protein beta-barrel domain-containing protein n=1 Tax=Candidatus Cardinium hertigii TaxID=247481 RepID=A0A3N2QC01_9BACT|nr:hypothetical protein [Candidatus Cardinium hertigii]ROT47337.1 hypothetical protein EDM02_02760 [Candidatus Cardinium hertigii]